MSEIEKMYENVKLTNLYCGDDYIAEYMLQSECTNDNEEKCKTCDKVKISYPPFTTEKQLELIKLLAKNDNIYITYYPFDNTYNIRYCVAGFYDGSVMGDREVTSGDFEETLAGIINAIWQDLTEEEKQQVKEILE